MVQVAKFHLENGGKSVSYRYRSKLVFKKMRGDEKLMKIQGKKANLPIL